MIFKIRKKQTNPIFSFTKVTYFFTARTKRIIFSLFVFYLQNIHQNKVLLNKLSVFIQTKTFFVFLFPENTEKSYSSHTQTHTQHLAKKAFFCISKHVMQRLDRLHRETVTLRRRFPRAPEKPTALATARSDDVSSARPLEAEGWG